MSRCLIFGASEQPESFLPRIRPDDLVIAADGGFAPLLAAGVHVDAVIGDFDSLGYVPRHPELMLLPAEKEVTDSWAAVDYGYARGCREFLLYWCTGGRLDHTLANLQLLCDLTLRDAFGTLCDASCCVTVLRREALLFPQDASGLISVFSLSDACCGVSLEGLKYPLKDATLLNRFPLGISNEFEGTCASVRAGEGFLAVVYPPDVAPVRQKA